VSRVPSHRRTGKRTVGPLVRAKTAGEWRAWLVKNHDRAPEAWLVIPARASGRPFVEYADAVDEALCFGWIDSIVKSLGGGVRAQRFTPRRPGSTVSELNRARVRRLVREGRMTPRGMTALPGVDRWLEPSPLVVAPDIEQRIRAVGEAWKHFRDFPDEYKRIRLGWIEGARSRPEVFEQRLSYFVRKTAQGKRFGTVPE
jgi:uncharacterized protein YdeI (YjbR/CyaY-like superfamily)